MSSSTYDLTALYPHQLTASRPYNLTSLWPHHLIKLTTLPTHKLINTHHQKVFCLVFGWNFNIVSALFFNQSPTLPQKIDSREGLF